MTEETIFTTALQKTDLSERAAFLGEACGADAELRRRVEELLGANDKAGAFLNRPAVETDPNTTHLHTETHDEQDDLSAILTPSNRPGSLGWIGHYEVFEVLGRGGFGIVFRAFDDVLQRVVAVKVMNPSMAATSPARKRFLREARSSAQVRHENVVLVHAVEEQPYPFLVMEFVPGETLQERVDRTGPLDIREVVRIARQIADGLAAAHATGLIHRDIKPSNILIEKSPQERVKITDFGLARAADDASLTRSGTVAGTPMYMAPEQARGESLDHRADLFSLGSVLYLMCTGRPPFRASTTFAVLKRVAEESPRPIREVIPEVPEWFCRIVEKLHAKNPEDRYQTAREVAEVLVDCEEQLKDHARLKDFKRIPLAKPKPPRQAKLKLAYALIAITFLIIVILWAGPFAYRYVQNQGGIEFNGDFDQDVKKIMVLENGTLIATLDRESPHATLRPGEYKLEAISAEGFETYKFQIRTKRLYPDVNSFERFTGRPAIPFIVRRGDFTTIAATTQKTLPSLVPSASVGTDGFVPLFNGKDLSGWQTDRIQPNTWSVKDGVLRGEKGPSYLISEKPYANFHLRLEAKLNKTGHGGVGFRGANGSFLPDVKPSAYLTQLNSPGVPKSLPTGSLYLNALGEVVSDDPQIPHDTWFTLEVIANNFHIGNLVNGKPILDYQDTMKHYDKGHLALYVTGENSAIEFRNIEIKELPASAELSDKERLQGHWIIQSGERKGKPISTSDLLRDLRVYFYGRHVFFLSGSGSEEGSFTLKHTTNPKQFNFLGRVDGNTGSGIYRLEGDQFEMCFAEGNERPTEFKSSKTEPWPWTARFKRDPVKEPDWTPLFNGRDLIGWAPQTKSGKWQVTSGGILTGTGSGYLLSQRDFVNFHLRAEVRIGEDGHSGIAFRVDKTLALDAKAPAGFQALINATDQRNPRTGSLLDSTGKYAYGKAPPVPADTWFTYEIIAIGNDITLKVNGVETLDGPHGDRSRSIGPIGLIMPGEGKTVSFRNIEIKELPGTSWGGTPKVSRADLKVKPLEDLVTSKTQTRDNTKAMYDAGVSSRADLISTEIELLDARVQLAEAKKDHAAVVTLLGELVTQRQADRDLIDKQVKIGTVAAEELNKADARLAEAKVRLAKAKEIQKP